jgi:hypothetical protein
MKFKPLIPFGRYISPLGKDCIFQPKGDAWQEVAEFSFGYVTPDCDTSDPDGKPLGVFSLSSANAHTLNAMRFVGR